MIQCKRQTNFYSFIYLSIYLLVNWGPVVYFFSDWFNKKTDWSIVGQYKVRQGNKTKDTGKKKRQRPEYQPEGKKVGQTRKVKILEQHTDEQKCVNLNYKRQY